MTRTVLVTGATGFTGRSLANRLVDDGHRVRALVHKTTARQAELDSRIDIIQGDVCDRETVGSAVRGCDTIFHLAAVYRSARHSDQYYENVNVGGTQHLLDASRKYDVDRFVHCSTIGVHGDIENTPADEDAPLQPSDIYQATKLRAEQLVHEALRSGLSGVIVRPAAIYGPGDRRFLKLFRTIRSRRFRMFGDGEVNLHLIYIDDLVQGFISSAWHPDTNRRTYILAGREYVTLNHLAAEVARVTGVTLRSTHWPFAPLWMAAVLCEAGCRPFRVEPPLHRRRVEFFRKNRAFSTDRARSEFGFVPAVELREGLRRTAEWYHRQGWLRM